MTPGEREAIQKHCDVTMELIKRIGKLETLVGQVILWNIVTLVLAAAWGLLGLAAWLS